MQVNDLHNLENTDLLTLIKKQQKELLNLNEKIKSLESNLNKKETETINEAISKVNMILKETEQSLIKIRQIQTEDDKYLKELHDANKSEFGKDVHKLTNDENLKDTDVENKNILIYTEEKRSQTNAESSENIDITEEKMMIPLNTSLTIIKPKFLKRIVDKSKIKLILVYTISFLIVAFSLFQIFRLYKQKNATIKLTTGLQSYITEKNDLEVQNESKYIVDFDGLGVINSDTIGWIKVNGVPIDFPVVQTNDNSYYLKHSYDKSYNVCGWIFADYRNKLDGTDKNIIIYGHNRKDGTMFSPMINILNNSWYDTEENKYVTFITKNNEEITYEVFSVYQIKVEDYYIQTQFSNDEEYESFLHTLKSRSVKNYNIDLTAEDQILTLSTCGKENKYRVVLHAKKL